MINESDIQELEEIGISRTEILYWLIESVKKTEKARFAKMVNVPTLLSSPLYE